MALKQETIVMRRTDKDGNTVIQFPVTTTDNVEGLNETLTGLIDVFYPVGTLFWNESADANPNNLFPGTTWEQVKDKFILAAGDTYKTGNTGGEAAHALTTAEMPAHTHSRGTMDITGTVGSIGDSGATAGAFYESGTTGSVYRSGAAWRTIKMTASRSWSGATSSAGSGSAHNNMPPYVVAYCWKRTA